MPSLTLGDLSAELLAEIFELIHDSSRHTIFSLLRVSKFISEAASLFAYRELTFDFTQTPQHEDVQQSSSAEEPYTRTLQQIDLLLDLPLDHTIWKSVRKVNVHSTFVSWQPGAEESTSESLFTPSEEAVQARWRSFIEFVSDVVCLREIVFDCTERFPIALLRTIEAIHPSCHLHVKNWTRSDRGVRAGDPYEEALGLSTCLKSIQAHFVCETPGIDYRFEAFQRILALSPSLQGIAYSKIGGGFAMITDPEQQAERRRESERFRVEKPVKKTSVRRIKWETLNSALVQRWETFIDLRNVETLELDSVINADWMEYAMDHGTFRGLKHLAIKINSYPRLQDRSQSKFKSTLERFLSTQSPLESLSITRYHGYIDFSLILPHHGATLRSLSLHQVERTTGPRPVLTEGDFNLIRSEARHLEDLEFDLNRTRVPGENEMRVYNILSTFQSLRRITIHYDVGLYHVHSSSSRGPGGETRTPPETTDLDEVYATVDRRFAREVWRAVCNRRLDKLVLYVGELVRPPPPLWVYRREREARNRVWLLRLLRPGQGPVASSRFGVSTFKAPQTRSQTANNKTSKSRPVHRPTRSKPRMPVLVHVDDHLTSA
ncbi:hypothetical protein PQX77_018063 [Marasmius sp. AFHP31]|nr:hypothetical protein PQX77_018063 [Marasmius sp. AFHP31]